MLQPEDFFDLSSFRYGDLFDHTEYVWDTLKRRDAYIQEIIKPSLLGNISQQAIIRGEVSIGKGSTIEAGAMIIGPTIIGENTLIRHGAYIRGNVIVGNSCIIGHATEVKGTIVLNDTELSHFNYVGDSIIGSNVLLGAGAKTANVKITGGNISVTIGGEEYDTELVKFGAIVGDGVHVGCNCVLNPGTMVGKRTGVYANISLRGYYPGNHIIKLKQSHQCSKRSSQSTHSESRN